jgi:Fe2+ transport system protein FeoA
VSSSLPGPVSTAPEPTPGRSTPLCELPPSVLAVVESVDCEDATTERMMDLGLVPGTRIRFVRRAPLGDPGVYELRGIQLCLRRSEARRVRVRWLAPARP